MQSRQFKKFLSLTFLVFITAASSNAKDNPAAIYLSAEPVQISRQNPVMTVASKDFLQKRDGDIVKVWVFFTDKNVNSKLKFEKAASSVSLSEKVLKRRAKVNLDYVVYADLPVAIDYINKMVELGGNHRRTSKWQNGASFEIPFEKLNDIESLPFVAEIRPLATYTKPILPEVDLRKESFGPQKQEADALDYGQSINQLVQIGVPALHALGYDGAGVTLAILDTGFRKSHEVFAQHYADGRVLAEYDFVFGDSNTANESGDHPNQWFHGTYIWSASGGHLNGVLYGPAYKANFILCKTEDYANEVQIEEDNWVAAVEWSDSLGADVLTSSLGYIDWYIPADLDGATAVTTIEANMAASMGIVLCNAAGNYGPGGSTLIAPADAHDILAVGAVASNGTIANFSSRGPTADGRIKPEVCARGVSTWAATAGSDNSYSGVSGTSLSTPLVAGAACLLVQARPNFPPTVIRQAFMETANNADSPDNDYGWGVIDAEAALGWGAEFTADTTYGHAPLTIQFTANTSLPASSWEWTFGDGGTSNEENPSYQYDTPGTYDVTLTTQTVYGPVSNTKSQYIVLYGDTLQFSTDSAFAGQSAVVNVNIINSQALSSIVIPFEYGTAPNTMLDSVTLGARTSYFEDISQVSANPSQNRYAYHLTADDGGGSPALAPGSGEILKIFLTIDSFALGGQMAMFDSTSMGNIYLRLSTSATSYTPVVYTGGVMTKNIFRGDCNRDFRVDILDLLFLVNYIFRFGPPPITIQAGDNNKDLFVNITDLNYIVNHIFRNGPAPPSP